MITTSLLLPALLAACGTPAEEPCEADIAVWEDLDGDGYGGASLGKVCAIEAGQVEVAQDCDDADAAKNPLAVETCDGIDNDCDGRLDDDANLRQYWFDGDGDTFGGLYRSQLACEDPGEEWVPNADDCNDRNPSVSPDGQEVCGNVDEDCDGYIDESDDSVDPDTFSVFFRDGDGDGYGDPNDTITSCRLIPGYVLEGNDCDDNTAALTQVAYYTDADLDGYGDPNSVVMGCRVPPAGSVSNDDDCDDSDPTLTYESDWFDDLDGDTYGSGVSLGFSCVSPEAGAVRDGGDCNDSSPAINPGANDPCQDGIDQDCSGSDPACGPVGSYLVEDGPNWTGDPPVYSCIEACAVVFGGSSADYHCSTSGAVLNNLAYMSGYADATYCFTGRPEDYSLEPAGNPGYNCGGFGCAYSAYVQDNCFGSRNYCWPN